MLEPISTNPPSISPLALQKETLQKLPTQPAPDAGAVQPQAPIISDFGCVLDKRV